LYRLKVGQKTDHVECTSQDRLLGEIPARAEQNVLGTDNEFIEALLAIQQTATWHQEPDILATQKQSSCMEILQCYNNHNTQKCSTARMSFKIDFNTNSINEQAAREL